MADIDQAGFDADAVHEKYRIERDKRLVPGRTDTLDLGTGRWRERYSADPFTPVEDRDPIDEDVDAVVVGAGIAGILAAVEMRKAGLERIRVVDVAGGFGGTWYWNRYPGVMCDVESYIYMPMLEEMDYVPQDRYASGDEIRRHLVAITERFDLGPDALFHTSVQHSAWDEDAARWRIETDRGDRLGARYLVLAVGVLNLLKIPAIPGIEDYEGHSFHTARWDYAYTGGGPGEPLTELADKTVGLVGTGATGIQCVRALADAAQQVYVFQRTPSAIGVRGNRPTDPDFTTGLAPGWQQERMDNFQAIMLGKTVEEDLTDDGWTRHYAAVHNPPRRKGMTVEEMVSAAEQLDYGIMEEHRARVSELIEDPDVAEVVKPYYRYLCKRPCFHDDYLPVLNEPNVTFVSCPGGWDALTEAGPVVGGEQYDIDCLVFATGFEPEVTPLPVRAGHEVVGRSGLTLGDKFADGAATYFGMLVRDFPNMIVMPAPAQQSVITVNYTQLAVLGAEFVGGLVGLLEAQGARCFDVGAEAEERWVDGVVSTHVDASAVMAACTPSRINNEGDPQLMDPRSGNFGRGYGDYFEYRDILRNWLTDGSFDGLEVEIDESP